MFDVGFWELVLIFGLGLMILGPEKLPRIANQIGRWVGKARRTAGELRRQLERELDFDELAGKKSYSRPKPPPPPAAPTPEPPVTDHAPANHAEIDPPPDVEPDAAVGAAPAAPALDPRNEPPPDSVSSPGAK